MRAQPGGPIASIAAAVVALCLSTVPARSVEPRLFTAGNGTIQSARLDGSDARVIATQAGDAIGVDPLNLKLYYASAGLMSDGWAYRSNLDGSAVEPFLTGWRPHAYALDPANNRIFFATIGSHNAYVATLSNPQPTTWHYGLNSLVDMQYAPTANRLFVANASSLTSGDQVWAIPMDGPLPKTIVEGIHGLSGVAVDEVHQKLYFSAETERSSWERVIYRSNLDGSDLQIWIDNRDAGVSTPADVDVVPELNAIFWADEDLGAVFRASLDGTNIQRILSAPGVRQIAVLVPEPALAPLLSALALLLYRSHPTRPRHSSSGK